MKNNMLTLLLTFLAGGILVALLSFRASPSETTPKYMYCQFSTVESIIPGGLGRSRVLTTDDKGTLIEGDLKNFYSMVGINFGNIANNDQVIVSKINDYVNNGWELFQVTAGVQSPSGGDHGSSQGIFITRYLFRRPV